MYSVFRRMKAVPALRVSPAVGSPGARDRRLPVALQSLRHPNYRLLWIGTLIFEPGLEIKVYVTSLAVSLIVVRILVTRHRKRSLPEG